MRPEYQVSTPALPVPTMRHEASAVHLLFQVGIAQFFRQPPSHREAKPSLPQPCMQPPHRLRHSHRSKPAFATKPAIHDQAHIWFPAQSFPSKHTPPCSPAFCDRTHLGFLASVGQTQEARSPLLPGQVWASRWHDGTLRPGPCVL